MVRRHHWLYGVCAVFTLLVMACSGSTNNPAPTNAPSSLGTTTGGSQLVQGTATPSAEKPKRGGVFRHAEIRDPATPGGLDPHTNFDPTTLWGVWANVSNGVMKRGAFNSVLPDLAEKYTVSSDGKEWTFNLRKGVKFQNVEPVMGREFTSDDVKYTIERFSSPDPNFGRNKDFALVDKIDLPDKSTVKFTLKEASALFLNLISDPYVLIVPKELVDKYGDKTAGGRLIDKAVGTGPYILKEYKKDVGTVLERNPDYWDKDNAGWFDRIEYKVIPDEQQRLNAFRGGEIDILTVSRKEQADTLAKLPNTRVKTYLSGSPFSLAPNNSVAPWNNVKVRQALRYALDVQEFIDVALQGGGEQLTGPVPLAWKEYALPKDQYAPKRDLNKARQLLKDSGVALPIKTTLNSTAGINQLVDNAQIIKKQLAEVDIQVEIKELPFGDWYASYFGSQFELFNGVDLAFADPGVGLATRFSTGGVSNGHKYSNPQVDQLLQKQAVATSVEDRKKLILDAQKIIWDEAGTLPLYSTQNFYFEYNYMRGYEPSDAYAYWQWGQTSYFNK